MVHVIDAGIIEFCNGFCYSVFSDDDMISIGSMLSLGDSYYLDDDDLEVAPSPRLRHKRNLSHGHGKVTGITYLCFCDHHLERRSHAPWTTLVHL